MSAIWSDHITFGLVSLPVQLHPATQESRPRLHEVHVGCGSRVRHRRWCEVEGRKLAREGIAHGWQAPDGRVVVLRDVDLDDLPLPTKRVIEVLGFVPEGAVDPLRYARSYYAAVSAAYAGLLGEGLVHEEGRRVLGGLRIPPVSGSGPDRAPGTAP